MGTGKLGVEIAKEAYYRGYETKLFYGFGSAEIPEYINTTRFTTTQSLLERVLEEIGNVDIYISSAAVSDYAPIYEHGKISSERDELTIKLLPTPKVLKQAKAAAKPGSIFVAFKLGYNLSEQELLDQARRDYGDVGEIIVANDLININESKHEAVILYKGNVISRVHSKPEIARAIFNCLEEDLVEKPDKYYGRLRSDIPSNKKAIKKVLNTDREKSIRLFERVFADKILSDIVYILNQGWADEISREDFFHGHGFFRKRIPLFKDYDDNLRIIISQKSILPMARLY